ncbi:uracil-DNA glycosylase family protein [Kiloniella sp. b19]|uniref:uracil-DNA glycosylase family protein n=1 Tax=Kiloniella sp. GXU_MW_B19 TaxID=3141326 RepID=UPI0031DFF115
MSDPLASLQEEIRACRHCEAHLPLGPRPVVRGKASARILIIGQAPGTRVHESGKPWDDASGQRLREWMALEPNDFYDESKVAIMPMGFCYPGRLDKGGDAPPRPECAPLWHDRLRAELPAVELTLLVGLYAQKYYLGKDWRKNLTATVQDWRAFGPDFLPTPHPSWRSTMWLRKNPWFEEDVLPHLRSRVGTLMQ